MSRAVVGIILLVAVFSAGLVAPAAAVRIQGSSGTAAYVQQVAKTGSEDDFENRIRLYERLRFDLEDFAGPRFSFHGFLTARNDLTNQSLGETRTRLYQGYARFRSIPAAGEALRYDVRVGRQWITAGVGSGTLDGAGVTVERPGWGGATLFGGTLGVDARELWRLDSPTDSRRLGGVLRIHPRIREAIDPEAVVSYASTRRHDLDENERVGGHASLRVRRQLRLWSEVRHDLKIKRTYGTSAGVEFLKASRGLRAWAEFNKRTPLLPATSFFSVFDTRPVSELRGGLGIGLGGPYRASIDFARTDFKGGRSVVTVGGGTRTRSTVDRAKAYRLVLQRGMIQVGGRIYSGFGGDRSGLVVSALRDFGSVVSARLDLGIEKYDYGDTPIEDNDAASGLLAVTYRPRPGTLLTGQVEGLNNRDLKQDVRLLVRVDQQFGLKARMEVR